MTKDRSTMHPKFNPTAVRTHDLQTMTVQFMSLMACSNHYTISDFCSQHSTYKYLLCHHQLLSDLNIKVVYHNCHFDVCLHNRSQVKYVVIYPSYHCQLFMYNCSNNTSWLTTFTSQRGFWLDRIKLKNPYGVPHPAIFFQIKHMLKQIKSEGLSVKFVQC